MEEINKRTNDITNEERTAINNKITSTQSKKKQGKISMKKIKKGIEFRQDFSTESESDEFPLSDEEFVGATFHLADHLKFAPFNFQKKKWGRGEVDFSTKLKNKQTKWRKIEYQNEHELFQLRKGRIEWLLRLYNAEASRFNRILKSKYNDFLNQKFASPKDVHQQSKSNETSDQSDEEAAWEKNTDLFCLFS